MTDALLLVAHGSPDHPAHRQVVEAMVEKVRRRTEFSDVGAAYVDDEPRLSRALDSVDSDSAVAVPVFTANGYYVDEVLPRELPTEVELTPPVGTHPALTDVLRRRAAEAAEHVDPAPESTALAVVGHGTPRHGASGDSVYRHVERLRRRCGFAGVRAAFLDEEPLAEDLAADVDQRAAAVVPFFVADGPHATVDVPEAIGFTDIPADPPHTETVEGVTMTYTSAVLAHQDVSKVVVERACEARARREAVEP